jgi:hypothetical protein
VVLNSIYVGNGQYFVRPVEWQLGDDNTLIEFNFPDGALWGSSGHGGTPS